MRKAILYLALRVILKYFDDVILLPLGGGVTG